MRVIGRCVFADTPEIGNRLVQLIRMDGSTRQLWVYLERALFMPSGLFYPCKLEPRHEKTCLRGFRPGMTQTGLLNCRDKLEA